MSHHCAVCGCLFNRMDSLRRHTITGACKGVAVNPHSLSEERSHVESLGLREQLGVGRSNEEAAAESTDSDIRESSAEEESAEERSDEEESVEERSDEEESDSEESVQDATDEEMSDAEYKEDSGNSSDDFDGECTDSNSSSEDEALRHANDSNSRFKHTGFARYGDGDFACYSAWVSRKRIPYVVRNREWLNNLRTTNPTRWRERLDAATSSQLEAIREMAKNAMLCRVVLHRRALKRIIMNHEEIADVASLENSHEELRQLLKKKYVKVLLPLLMWGLPVCIKSALAICK